MKKQVKYFRGVTLLVLCFIINGLKSAELTTSRATVSKLYIMSTNEANPSTEQSSATTLTEELNPVTAESTVKAHLLTNTADQSKETVTQISTEDPQVNTHADTVSIKRVEWRDVMNYVQIGFAVVGFVANVIVIYTLYREKGIFSSILIFLLKHQSVCDGLVCLFLVLFQVPPFGWKTHIYELDFFLCHFWHSQGLFWMFVSLSVWNLVLVTIERFLAVSKPLLYIRCGVKHFARVLFPVYILSFITSVPPTLFETSFVNGTCVGKQAFVSIHLDRFYDAYSIIWYLTNYMIPCAMFIVLYIIIIHVLMANKKIEKHGSSKTIDKATREITKMAVCVISVFAVALGFDNTMYMLSYWNHVVYKIGDPIQVAGLLVTTLNSVANPFIYTLMLPTFRMSLVKALGCGKKPKERIQEEQTASTNAPSVSNVV